MYYRGGRGVVPPDGIRPGQMIVKFHGWPRDMATQMCLWHIVMAEPLHKRHPLPRQMALGNVNVIQARPTTETYDMAGKHWLNTISLLSDGAVRRNSLRCAPFGPPTVSCVLAPARTCLRQAPPTSRGRGLATSAVPHHLTDDMAIKTFTLEKRCKKTPFFTPIQKIETNGVKSGRFLHRLSDTRIRSSVRARFLRDACPRRAR